MFDVVNGIILEFPADVMQFLVLQKYSNPSIMQSEHEIDIFERLIIFPNRISFHLKILNIVEVEKCFICFMGLRFLLFGELFLLCINFKLPMLREGMISQESHVEYRGTWDKLTSFIFRNFKISLASLERFQKFQKTNSISLG